MPPASGQVAAKVKGLRARQRLTLTELQRRSGVARQTIMRVEQGESAPHAGTLTALERAFDVPAGTLLKLRARALTERERATRAKRSGSR